MGKFSVAVKRPKTRTINLAGGNAYKETNKLELVSLLLTSFLKDKFYESESSQVDRLIDLISSCKDKKFVAKAAIYARTKFGMRSVSHLTASELMNQVKGEEWTKNFIDKVVYRPDDMTEILACYLSNYGKPIPNALKKGLSLAFNKFDEYSIAKYRGESDKLSLVDLVNLVHPKPNEKTAKILHKLMNGELKSKDTWESELTKVGQKAENEEEKSILKAEVWKDLILNKKIKYFALLRNLRNILEQAPELVDEVCEMLTNKVDIKKSLVLPFRFVTAYNEILLLNGSEARKVLKAISKAVDISCDNVPKFEGKTLIALDTSGSMRGQPLDIGALFSAVLVKNNDVDFMTFSDNANYMNLNTEDSVLTIADTIKRKSRMAGTNFNSIFQKADKAYDRVIILSDMQGWMSSSDIYSNVGGSPDKTFKAWKTKYNTNPKVFSFDLNGYGTLQFPENNVFCLAGFSEKTLDIMRLLEEDKTAMIREVEKIEL